MDQLSANIILLLDFIYHSNQNILADTEYWIVHAQIELPFKSVGSVRFS